MSESPRFPDSHLAAGDDNDEGPGRRATTGTPRWVKVSGIIALVVVLLFVVLLLTGGGAGHGPSRHTQSDGGLGANAPSVSVAGNIAGQP